MSETRRDVARNPQALVTRPPRAGLMGPSGPPQGAPK